MRSLAPLRGDARFSALSGDLDLDVRDLYASRRARGRMLATRRFAALWTGFSDRCAKSVFAPVSPTVPVTAFVRPWGVPPSDPLSGGVCLVRYLVSGGAARVFPRFLAFSERSAFMLPKSGDSPKMGWS